MLISLNNHLFLLVNAPLHPDFAVVVLAEVAAEWLVYAAMALLAALWIWGGPEHRGALLATVAGVSAALGINQLLGMLWYEPRPFMIGLGHMLIHHAADNSFPSDHATFMWSFGFSLIVTAAARRWGGLVCFIGLLVAWARIYLGLHFPIDMAASFLVALVGSSLSRILEPTISRRALPVMELVYLRSLQLLRLPPGLFPRTVEALPDAGRGRGG